MSGGREKPSGAVDPDLVGLAGSIAAMALGGALMIDDYKDIGKDGSERDPPIPHHYMYGIITLLGGVAGTCLFGLKTLKKVADRKRLGAP